MAANLRRHKQPLLIKWAGASAPVRFCGLGDIAVPQAEQIIDYANRAARLIPEPPLHTEPPRISSRGIASVEVLHVFETRKPDWAALRLTPTAQISHADGALLTLDINPAAIKPLSNGWARQPWAEDFWERLDDIRCATGLSDDCTPCIALNEFAAWVASRGWRDIPPELQALAATNLSDDISANLTHEEERVLLGDRKQEWPVKSMYDGKMYFNGAAWQQHLRAAGLRTVRPYAEDFHITSQAGQPNAVVRSDVGGPEAPNPQPDDGRAPEAKPEAVSRLGQQMRELNAARSRWHDEALEEMARAETQNDTILQKTLHHIGMAVASRYGRVVGTSAVEKLLRDKADQYEEIKSKIHKQGV